MEPKPSDLLMWVGEEFYPAPEDFSAEVIAQGLSKRIPINNPPQGLENGRSRLFLIHPQAGLAMKEGAKLGDLGFKLGEMTGIPPQSAGSDFILRVMRDWDRNPAFVMRRLLEWADTETPETPGSYEGPQIEMLKERVSEIAQAFEVRFIPAIFGFVYLTGMQYVCKRGEEAAPEHLRGLGVEPVRVMHEEQSHGE